jgi:phosphoglycerate dehydrogenase-like enzyme
MMSGASQHRSADAAGRQGSGRGVVGPVTVLIASYLEPEHVSRIARTAGVRVIYEPDLLPRPRYIADHTGMPLQRGPADERRWRGYLVEAEVMFDFDHTHLHDLPQLAPRVRWVQATSAGIGQLLLRTGLIRTPIVFTTASGIHATPLAEFALLAMLAFAKDLPRLVRDQASHRWVRYCARELQGTTVGIIGLGRVGRAVARACHALGVRVIGTRRTAAGREATIEGVDVIAAPAELSAVIREADALVLACPLTPETEGLIGAAELRSMKRGAVLVNIARGAVVDEPALIAALRDGHLGGAALDVTATEPLPPDSPLWDLPNVLISPHSASTADTENAKLTDLFCDNLGHYMRGEALHNVFDRERLY